MYALVSMTIDFTWLWLTQITVPRIVRGDFYFTRPAGYNCHPFEVDIYILNGLCRSFPHPHGMLDWGHDYGGIIEVSIPGRSILQNPYGRRVPKLKATRRNIGTLHGSADEVYFADPLDIPGLDLLLKETAEVCIPKKTPIPSSSSTSWL